MKKSTGIFIYLVAVIFVLAVFSYLETQHRGSGMVPETDLITAGQTIEVGKAIKEAVSSTIKNGVKAADLDFTVPDPSNLNSFFELENSPLPINFPPAAFESQKHYVFTGANKIPGVGTDAPEILFIAWPIKKEVCRQIDKDLGLGLDWVENHIVTTPPDLTPFHHEAGRPVTELNLSGSQYACVQDKNGVRYYIHTIVER